MNWLLIHKETMGVLRDVWTGAFRRTMAGGLEPVMCPVRLADLPDLDANAWWEVPAASPLGRKALRYYPWMEPVSGPDGALLDVIPTADALALEEASREAVRLEQLRKEAAARGYRQNARSLRPRNIMPFLNAKTSRGGAK